MKNYSWTLPLEVLYQDGIISLIQLNGFQFCGVRYLSDLRAEKHVIRNSYLKEEAVYLCSLINAVHIADNPNEDRKIFINSIPSHLKQIAEYSFRAINERIKSSVESSPIFDSSLLLLYNLFRQGKNLLDSFSDSEQRYVLIYFIDVLRNYSCCFKDCIYFSYYISNVLFKVSISFEDLLKARNIFYEEVKDSNPIKPHQVSNSIDNEFDKLVSNLSVRAQNVLRYNQIGSIEDFCSWVKDNNGKFMSLRSCGRKTAMELENLNKEIISNNLSVQRTTSVINSVEIANDDISESYFTFLIGKFQTWNNDKVKSWIVENFYTAENFFKELNYSAANVFSILYPKHTKNVFGELLSITEFITSAILCQESKNVSSRFKLQLFDFAKLILNNKDYLLESYLLTYHKKILLYEEFQKRLRELNVRSRNGLLKVVNPNSIDDIIKFINEDCDFMSIGHVGKKSSIGLNSFYNSLHQYFYGVLFSNEDDVKQDIVIKLFPFLSTQEVAFVYNFKVRYGYFPMFYVCKAFFEKSIRQKVNIYRGFYGIGLERPFDYDELTERYNITRERVRQLVSRPEDWIKDQNESLFDEGKWNNYKFIKLDILTEEKSEFNEIVKKESLNLSFFSFCGICNLIKPICVINLTSSEGQEYSIGYSRLASRFKVWTAIKEINRVALLQKTRELRVPLYDFYANNGSYWSRTTMLEKHQVNVAYNLLSLIIKAQNICEINKKGELVYKANKINYGDVIYNIINKNGAPMHINDIFSEFRKIYPNDVHDTPLSLKSFIHNDERIENIGKTSTYKLSSWNIYAGSIPQLLIQILGAHTEPMKSAKLVSEALKYRSSTVRSIESNISQKISDGTLIMFYPDLVGLKIKKYNSKYKQVPTDFDEYLTAFLDFVKANERYPFTNSRSYEGMLNRWYNSAKTLLNLSDSEIIKFTKMTNTLEEKHFPQTKRELDFKNKCTQFRDFVTSIGRMLTEDDDEVLYLWFVKSGKLFASWDDNRKYYFKNLMKFISENY